MSFGEIVLTTLVIVLWYPTTWFMLWLLLKILGLDVLGPAPPAEGALILWFFLPVLLFLWPGIRLVELLKKTISSKEK